MAEALVSGGGVGFLQPCMFSLAGAEHARSASSAAPAVPVATRWRRWQGELSAASASLLVVCGLAAVVGFRRLRRRSGRQAAENQSGAICNVPEDYRAAGVIFYTRDEETRDVMHVLLGVEERKISLRDMGGGSGSAKRSVLLFPQGKVEPHDRGFLDTARREFVEETDDPTGLASHLDALLKHGTDWWMRSPTLPTPSWYQPAKLAVVYCEVAREEVSKLSEAMEKRGKHCKFPLRPVWVEASQLRRTLNSANPASEVVTSLGPFPVFPLHRRFFRTPDARRWLEMAKIPVLKSRKTAKRRV